MGSLATFTNSTSLWTSQSSGSLFNICLWIYQQIFQENKINFNEVYLMENLSKLCFANFFLFLLLFPNEKVSRASWENLFNKVPWHFVNRTFCQLAKNCTKREKVGLGVRLSDAKIRPGGLGKGKLMWPFSAQHWRISTFRSPACWLYPLKPGGEWKSAGIRWKTVMLIYPDPGGFWWLMKQQVEVVRFWKGSQQLLEYQNSLLIGYWPGKIINVYLN
jgi:hypothetical protein